MTTTSKTHNPDAPKVEAGKTDTQEKPQTRFLPDGTLNRGFRSNRKTKQTVNAKNADGTAKSGFQLRNEAASRNALIQRIQGVIEDIDQSGMGGPEVDELVDRLEAFQDALDAQNPKDPTATPPAV